MLFSVLERVKFHLLELYHIEGSLKSNKKSFFFDIKVTFMMAFEAEYYFLQIDRT